MSEDTAPVVEENGQATESGDLGAPVVEPTEAEKAAEADFQQTPWQESLPADWRDQLDGLNSLDDALAAMKRGMEYHPALEAEELVTKVPEGAVINDDFNKQFRELGVKIGLTPAQAQALVDFEYAQMAGMQKQAVEAGTEELRKQWGVDYDRNAEKATQAMLRIDTKMGGKLSAALGNGGLANSPTLVEAFAIMGDLISEDSLSGGASGGSQQAQPETGKQMFASLGFH